MFERFTGEARQVVVRAQEASRELQHNYIGTEHVLLGLFDAPASVSAKVLHRVGLTKETVRADVIEIVGAGTEPKKEGHIPFTPRAKKVLELSLREALSLNHNHIGPEHVLLGLIREGEGVAAKILVRHAEDLDRLRRLVLAEMTEPATRTQKSTTAAEEAFSAAEALAGAGPVGSHHLLEALVRSEGSMAARVLADLGVDPETIAAKIDELDPESTTDATPEEAAARRMELRLAEDEVQLVFRDEQTLDLVRRVTELTGGPVRGTGPVAGDFVPLWTSTNELLHKLLGYLQPEQENEPKGLVTMVRKVMRDRLRRA
ncbi:ATP-dependent Clp protease ATP-binding subunit ClpC [Lentzea nigeriaca]|nr:ATP-dependent Clp protease ATP-binding subunit ClpC [Lentzea nigeriaca]